VTDRLTYRQIADAQLVLADRAVKELEAENRQLRMFVGLLIEASGGEISVADAVAHTFEFGSISMTVDTEHAATVYRHVSA
jgi:hypothetical protein